MSNFTTEIKNDNIFIMAFTYKYPRPELTADCIVITQEQEPKILLIQRKNEPFKGCWAFPGGFMNMDETTEECAIRELKEETGIDINPENIFQIGAYSEVNRDPRDRIVTVAYLTIVDKVLKVQGIDDAAKAEWFSIYKLPELAFDHNTILKDAILLYKTINDR